MTNVDTRDMIGAMTKVIEGTRKNPLAPGYANIKIESNENGLRLFSNSVEISVDVTIPTITDNPISCVVNGRCFYDVVTKALGETVDLEVNNTILNITSGKMSVSIPILDFESVAEREKEEESVSIPASDILNAASECFHALEKNDVDRRKEAFHLDLGDGGSKVVALDGHRIAIRDNMIGDVKEDAVVLGDPFLRALKMMPDDYTVVLPKSKSFVELRSESDVVRVTALSEKYFDIAKILTFKGKDMISFNKNDFINALEIIAIVDQFVVLTIKDGMALLTGRSTNGDASVQLSIQENAEIDLCICFDVKVLMDAVKAISDDIIEMYLTKNTAPAFIAVEGDTKEVVLPVKR